MALSSTHWAWMVCVPLVTGTNVALSCPVTTPPPELLDPVELDDEDEELDELLDEEELDDEELDELLDDDEELPDPAELDADDEVVPEPPSPPWPPAPVVTDVDAPEPVLEVDEVGFEPPEPPLPSLHVTFAPMGSICSQMHVKTTSPSMQSGVSSLHSAPAHCGCDPPPPAPPSSPPPVPKIRDASPQAVALRATNEMRLMCRRFMMNPFFCLRFDSVSASDEARKLAIG